MTTNRGNPYVAGISADLVIATILVHFFGVRHPYMTTYSLGKNAPIPYTSILSADGSTPFGGNFRLKAID